ncbi:MAG: hypothetical protein HUU56_10340 [Bdellovibrionaceae bacterium]|nr:hypothetical protein [Pseudobdellovibrionaceae bacterium]
MEEREQNKDIHTNTKEDNLTRIVVLKESDKIASEIQELVNNGFEAGRASKLDVVSFIFTWFKANITDDLIHQLRMSCTDELTMLENVLKKAKSSGNLPPELRSALAQHFFGGVTPSLKKNKKSLKQDGIIDTNKESEAA